MDAETHALIVLGRSFHISAAARLRIEELRASFDASAEAGKAAETAVICWAFLADREADEGWPTVTFYDVDESARIPPELIFEQAGLQFVLFLTSSDHHRFRNRTLDVEPDGCFVLIPRGDALG
jgi:hypothetical protein